MAAFCTQLGSYGAVFNHHQHMIQPTVLKILLQEGSQGPNTTGIHSDQGGQLEQGGLGHDRGHDHHEGQGQGPTNHIDTPLVENDCESVYVEKPLDEYKFEHVCEVASLVETRSDRPVRDVNGHRWSLRCVQDVVVQPGTTQRVHVQWPVLSTKEFVALDQQKMLWEICGDESGVPGGQDRSCSQLVGGIGPLRIGKQAKACVNVLFHNPGEKKLLLLVGDVLGHTRLAGQGYINPDWY